MSENTWQSDKKFLKVVASLQCLSPSKTNSIKAFSNDAEILYTTLYSIVNFSDMDDRVRREADAELKAFADSAQIPTYRQRDLRRKVQISQWDAKTTVNKQRVDPFIDDFVAVCLQVVSGFLRTFVSDGLLFLR